MPCAGANIAGSASEAHCPAGLVGHGLFCCHRLVREGIGGFLPGSPRRRCRLVDPNQHPWAEKYRNALSLVAHNIKTTLVALRPLLHRQINVAHNQSIELEPAMEVDNLAGGDTYS
jgi:hypothetical protein